MGSMNSIKMFVVISLSFSLIARMSCILSAIKKKTQLQLNAINIVNVFFNVDINVIKNAYMIANKCTIKIKKRDILVHAK